MTNVEVNAAGKPLKIPPQKGLSIFDKKTAKLIMAPANMARPIF